MKQICSDFAVVVRTAVAVSSLCLLMAVSPRLAQAQIAFNLTPSFESTTPGNEAYFYGTIDNTGSTTAYLNDISFNFSGGNPSSSISGDDSVFFGDVPASLGAGDSYSGEIFGINVPSNTTAGVYNGSVTIQGSTDPSMPDELNSLATQNFQVNVSLPEPEAALLTLLGCGVIASAGFHRQRRSLTMSD